ncbi:hypothetical protein CK203_092755 [Vitis vinifera]|uniref:Uncharacterized protein n=1 Tax=Vitis vinifera TaxID=29760 RepID=A0A438EP83_VITVI|nr:hypothetical protein CK203_092755 [Vitis vinifera]
MHPFLLPLLARINQLRPYLSAGPKRKEYGLGEVEEGKEEECGDQKQSVGTEASRGALTRELTTQI